MPSISSTDHRAERAAPSRGGSPQRALGAVALLLAGIGPAPCEAQAPASAAPVAAASTRPAPVTRPSPSAVNPVAPPVAATSSSALPSTVSPTIARFLKQAAREAPGAATPLPLPPPATAARTPGPTPPMASARPTAAPARVQAPAPAPAPVSPPVTRAADLPTAPRPPARPGAGPASAGLYTPSTEALATGMRLKPAPVLPTDRAFPINLATALRLSDARPLVVAAAQAGVWVAEAELTRAKVLWVPSIIAGVDYTRHDGGAAPDVNKGLMLNPSLNYFNAGAGANLFINLTDAIYEPLVARQVLNARHWDVQASKNDALLRTSDAYFLVHRARGTYAGALYCVERGRDLVDRVASLAGELVPAVEVERARNMLADMEQRAAENRRDWRVRSAELTRVLRLDPRAVVEPLEHDHAQVTLIDPARQLDDLMPIALANRPEIAAHAALVQAAEHRIRREKNRPLLPIAMLGGFQTPGMFYQGGIFALGPNGKLNQWVGREDVSAQLVWQLEGLGFGNLARIKHERGEQSREFVALRNAQDRVVEQVTQAVARVQAAAARVLQADRALRTAIITFNGHLEGLAQTRRLENVLILTFRPQEAVYSLEQLYVSFDEYYTTVSDYNRAQFDLFHALGYPAHEVAALRMPGDVMPVDTSRPGYLPPVGNGPPPASR